MTGTTATGRRQARHDRTRREILDAAWRLAERDGVAGLSLREVATAVGMRAPSLYTYFDSKDALYDALFADGNRQMRETLGAWAEARAAGADPVEEVAAGAQEFVRFCQASPARYQLLFTAAVPGWHPSEESYRLAEENLEASNEHAARAGIVSPQARDTYTALVSGFAAQQMSNDPQGDRWIRLIPGAVRALVDAIERGDIP